MTTTASLIASIRATIPEASAVEWTDPKIVEYLNRAYFEWCAELGQLPGPGWFTVDVTFVLPANTTAFALTGLSIPNSGTFAALKRLWYVPPSGDTVPIDSASPGMEDRWRLAVGSAPVGDERPYRHWLTRPGGVPTDNIHPVANADRNFRAYVRYLPPALTNTGESVQTDPRHDDVLIRGAVLRALEDAGETDKVLEQRHERDKNRFLEQERNASGEFEPETTKMTDFSEQLFGG